jgi:DNA-binding MarR family transcriptional regulator/N-acetylglutamate synthase-like GNAT family acetyltransferase
MSNVATVRSFNRFYTRRIGVLEEGLLHSPFSLTEVRVMYELAHRERPAAAALAEELRLDPGYLSRILRRFQKLGILRRDRSGEDGRQRLLSLTAKGRQTFDELESRQNDEVAALLSPLPSTEQRRLVGALATVEQLLGAERASTREPYLLRTHRPGDLGWIVHRHGALYAEEYGYDERFEALVARVVSDFVEHFDPSREHCWIAEKDGEIVGSIMLVKKSATVAKLRLLYVEPRARGLGIGERLVTECLRFARQARYRKVTLYTHGQLKAARHIYQKAGFRLAGEEPEQGYGPELVAQTWELVL